MSYRLFLDDFRMPHTVANYMNPVDLRKEYGKYNWEIVRSFLEFKNKLLSNGLPTHVSFDHDLADEHYDGTISEYENIHDYYVTSDREMTGYDCALFLIDFCKKNELDLPIIYVHSLNPIGRQAIKELIDKHISSWNRKT